VTSDIAPADLAAAPLGHATDYPDAYAPDVLYALRRAPQRAALGIREALPFTGTDLWTAYELTWLDPRGRPRIAVATLAIAAESPRIVESKSMKLYLGSFAQSRFANVEAVTDAIAHDLGAAVGVPVTVTIEDAATHALRAFTPLAGTTLDALDVDVTTYDVDPSLLANAPGDASEVLVTDLFRSMCPVTAQPDIASVQVAYEGPAIDRASLLRYLVSYRCHGGFHEHCVERIFVDLKRRCGARRLSVYARFLRRGGLDINPFRTDAGTPLPGNVRTPRQ
jgi:7-cyano-7-deazaguanine reductase